MDQLRSVFLLFTVPSWLELNHQKPSVFHTMEQCQCGQKFLSVQLVSHCSRDWRRAWWPDSSCGWIYWTMSPTEVSRTTKKHWSCAPEMCLRFVSLQTLSSKSMVAHLSCGWICWTMSHTELSRTTKKAKKHSSFASKTCLWICGWCQQRLKES